MSRIANTVVILPARGGSKRIPDKNIKEIHGQPMIYWPLMELRKLFDSDKIIVSTDSENIINKVKKIGLKVPFKRPKELSDDYTTIMPVATHALAWYESNINQVDFVLIVYPTAVLLSSADIETAFEHLREDANCDSVMSATHFPFPIQRAVFDNVNGYAEMFEPDNYPKRSQDLTVAMHDAGQFYVWRAASVRSGQNLTNSTVKLHQLHRNKVIDIDTLEDLEIAEEKLKLTKLSDFEKDWSF